MSKKKVVNINLIEAVGRVVELRKVGINWFGRCPYCGTEGYLCVPAHGEYWQCLRCGKKGTAAPVVEVKSNF